MNKQYIRAKLDTEFGKCFMCGETIVKNDRRQIVYFCCGLCRKKYRKKYGSMRGGLE